MGRNDFRCSPLQGQDQQVKQVANTALRNDDTGRLIDGADVESSWEKKFTHTRSYVGRQTLCSLDPHVGRQ